MNQLDPLQSFFHKTFNDHSSQLQVGINRSKTKTIFKCALLFYLLGIIALSVSSTPKQIVILSVNGLILGIAIIFLLNQKKKIPQIILSFSFIQIIQSVSTIIIYNAIHNKWFYLDEEKYKLIELATIDIITIYLMPNNIIFAMIQLKLVYIQRLLLWDLLTFGESFPLIFLNVISFGVKKLEQKIVTKEKGKIEPAIFEFMKKILISNTNKIETKKIIFNHDLTQVLYLSDTSIAPYILHDYSLNIKQSFWSKFSMPSLTQQEKLEFNSTLTKSSIKTQKMTTLEVDLSQYRYAPKKQDESEKRLTNNNILDLLKNEKFSGRTWKLDLDTKQQKYYVQIQKVIIFDQEIYRFDLTKNNISQGFQKEGGAEKDDASKSNSQRVVESSFCSKKKDIYLNYLRTSINIAYNMFSASSYSRRPHLKLFNQNLSLLNQSFEVYDSIKEPLDAKFQEVQTSLEYDEVSELLLAQLQPKYNGSDLVELVASGNLINYLPSKWIQPLHCAFICKLGKEAIKNADDNKVQIIMDEFEDNIDHGGLMLNFWVGFKGIKLYDVSSSQKGVLSQSTQLSQYSRADQSSLKNTLSNSPSSSRRRLESMGVITTQQIRQDQEWHFTIMDYQKDGQETDRPLIIISSQGEEINQSMQNSPRNNELKNIISQSQNSSITQFSAPNSINSNQYLQSQGEIDGTTTSCQDKKIVLIRSSVPQSSSLIGLKKVRKVNVHFYESFDKLISKGEKITKAGQEIKAIIVEISGQDQLSEILYQVEAIKQKIETNTIKSGALCYLPRYKMSKTTELKLSLVFSIELESFQEVCEFLKVKASDSILQNDDVVV